MRTIYQSPDPKGGVGARLERFSDSRGDRFLTGAALPAFTLLELLVVIAVIALILAIMLPALGAARRSGMAAACGTRLRELGRAVVMYGGDHDDRAIPLAYTAFEIIGAGPPVYWWGSNQAGFVDHEAGFVWPYLKAMTSPSSVFECPEQPWGSYEPQGAAASVTSTYGYNGYYLSPEHTPGYSFSIGHRPWQSLSKVADPARVFAFADSMIDFGGSSPRNCALLDPPRLFDGGGWALNETATTSFRHRGNTQAVHVDGHIETYRQRREWLTSPNLGIGSVTRENGPNYVPDWRAWNE
ncbi:MAG TPA: hypothetical protein VNT79_02070 [Phycisphaerae bacterium]|nr:hypothetical protein [Phycisphaerae bacterium]